MLSPRLEIAPAERADVIIDFSKSAGANLVLSEKPMADGRVMQVLNGKEWTDPITERVRAGSAEMWYLVNNTPSAHSFHVHLVQFQIIDRRPFNRDEYEKIKQIVFSGEAVAAEPNEQGWKDTVKMPAGFVTRIIMRFPDKRGFYAYHCHILEHEDMDMMRPFEVY